MKDVTATLMSKRVVFVSGAERGVGWVYGRSVKADAYTHTQRVQIKKWTCARAQSAQNILPPIVAVYLCVSVLACVTGADTRAGTR